MSEAESPLRQTGAVTVEDVRQLMGASTPHFALQLRGRIARLIAHLPADDPARLLGEQEIARLTDLGFTGEVRGTRHEPTIKPLASVSDPAAAVADDEPAASDPLSDIQQGADKY